MKLVTLQAGKLYHVIDEAKNCIVAIIETNPWGGEWIAKQPRTNKILARDSRFTDLTRKMGA